MTGKVGVICGLAAEAECLELFSSDSRPSLRVAGASVARAHAAAKELIAEGCIGLVSFGVAGGLDPSLAAGTIVLASAVVADDGQTWSVDVPWQRSVRDSIANHVPATIGVIAGQDRALTSREAKESARRMTGAVAVDMESHGVAVVAAEAGLPFLVVRAIADPATRAIPEWIANAVAPDGTVIPQRIAGRLFARPWTVWTLIGLARENGRALRNLRATMGYIGGKFSWPDR